MLKTRQEGFRKSTKSSTGGVWGTLHVQAKSTMRTRETVEKT